jgi:hypothetical protein
MRRSTCILCDGGEICAHKKRRRRCKICDFVGFIYHLCQSRIYKALKTCGGLKTKRTQQYIGCDYSTLKIHIEKQFKPGMNWENHGSSWHVDHIIPIKYENPTEKDLDIVIQRLHYTNLQPLWASENMSKGNRWIG